VAPAIEHEVHRWHRDDHVDTLHAHHQNVIGISQTHSWQIAVEYDIQQCKLAYMDKAHDYTLIDRSAIALIATRVALSSMKEFQTLAGSSPAKQCFVEDSASLLPSPKKQRTPSCFRCGLPGHLPADCTASTTTAGKPTTPLLPNAKSGHALQAPNGTQFCFSFILRGSCKFGPSCSFAHCYIP
jgi:hypothetical protein